MGVVIFLLVFIAFCIIMAIVSSKARKKKKEKISGLGYDSKDTVNCGSYIGGHVNIDNEIEHVSLMSNNDNIAICNTVGNTVGEIKATIEKKLISDVKFEDATSFEKRVGVGRLLLVGVFAFAWKKKAKNENAYVIIEWNDGRFNHETSFMFNGSGSTGNANKARNWIIKHLQ